MKPSEKTHKKHAKDISDIMFGGMEITNFIEKLKTHSSGMVDPVIEVDGYGCENFPKIIITGWIPKTPQEIAQYKKKEARIKAATQTKKEKQKQKEIEQLEQLAKKHGFILQTETKI